MTKSNPYLVPGVPGPAGEPGVLLIAEPSETLEWDLQSEVASTSRFWMADRQAWWVAAAYASTAEAIVRRAAEEKASLAAAPDRVPWIERGVEQWQRTRLAMARLTTRTSLRLHGAETDSV